MQWVSTALVLVALAGCAHTQEALPEGSVALGNDVYMVPVGKDDQGCVQYTARSDVHAVTTVIQYRKADGSFTPIREEADCLPKP